MANECTPMHCNESGGNAEGKHKMNEVWRKPTKVVTTKRFCKNHNNKRKNNNNVNVNKKRHNALSDDIETEMKNEEDAAQTMMKEEINTMTIEKSQEQQKDKILEVENDVFENAMRDYTIELNTMQKQVKKRKKEGKGEQKIRKQNKEKIHGN